MFQVGTLSDYLLCRRGNWQYMTMEQFLQSVEKKAFNMAMMATHHQQDALDIVQNTMISLVKAYSDKTSEEWKPLFYRILQNEIKNWAKKQSLISKWFFTKKFTGLDVYTNDSNIDNNIDNHSQNDNVDGNGFENVSRSTHSPEQILENQQLSQQLLSVLSELPLKQQQCFLLRSWEGLSVKDTALAMKCSEGTVKTHMSRASAKLKGVYEMSE